MRYIDQMKLLFEYLDYREYLRDYYEDRKKEQSWYSLRSMGVKLGLDAAYLLRIMQKREHLSPRRLPALAEYFKFSDRETEYLGALVGFSRARTREQASLYFDKLMTLKPMDTVYLEPLQYEYYRTWYYSAVLAVMTFLPVKGDYRKLARTVSPAITTREAKEAVALLTKLKLVNRNKEGFYERTHQHISTGPEIRDHAVRLFQREMIQLSAQAIDNHPKENRDISTLTLNMNAGTLSDIRQILSECRQSIIARVAEDEETDCAYQVNIQVFPLSLRPPAKEGL